MSISKEKFESKTEEELFICENCEKKLSNKEKVFQTGGGGILCAKCGKEATPPFGYRLGGDWVTLPEALQKQKEQERQLMEDLGKTVKT